MYDISTLKYKQIQKMRNATTDNIEATEKENATENGFQKYEIKSNRMWQLFLTDGILE